MTEFFRAYRVAGEGKTTTFLAATAGQARDGLTIAPGAWRLGNYRRNPVVLFCHRYDEPPIGKTTRVDETDAGLIAEVEWDTADPTAAEIARKYRAGFLNAVSVGWATLEQDGNRVLAAELLDISAVPVPGDPNALVQARQRYARAHGPARLSPADRVAVLAGIRAALLDYQIRTAIAEEVRTWQR